MSEKDALDDWRLGGQESYLRGKALDLHIERYEGTRLGCDPRKVPRLALRIREERDQREEPPPLVGMPSALAARTTFRSKETAVAPVCLAVASR